MMIEVNLNAFSLEMVSKVLEKVSLDEDIAILDKEADIGQPVLNIFDLLVLK